jgi:hypothetical protein
MRGFEERLAEVERVNAQLEEAALTTARALGEVSRHWDAVCDATATRRQNRPPGRVPARPRGQQGALERITGVSRNDVVGHRNTAPALHGYGG